MNRNNRRNSELNTPGGMLVRLKNKILSVLRIDSTRYNLIIEKYAIRLNDGKRNSSSQHTRTNLMNEFNRNTLTIKKFFSFLMALELKSVKITVTFVTKEDNEYSVEETAFFRTEEPVNLKENKDEND